MREIKFRFWNKNTKRFEEAYPVSSFGINQDFIELEEFYEIMQFTGLKDKNGKEIYEGDIIKHPICEIGTVVFFQPYAGFNVSKGDFLYHLNEDGGYEVIGNIYEHSHLLNNG